MVQLSYLMKMSALYISASHGYIKFVQMSAGLLVLTPQKWLEISPGVLHIQRCDSNCCRPFGILVMNIFYNVIKMIK